MLPDNLNVALVEDNELARSNIRNHLLNIGFSEIASFSNGRELKANLKLQHFDVLLMDFHLGQNKNGVEVIQELRHLKLLKHSTCVVFITSDSLPIIIGQIVDIHPEALIVKPYTIRNFTKNVVNSIKLHLYLLPVYKLMDLKNFQQALQETELLIYNNAEPRRQNTLIKLQARLLSKLGRYHEASELYRDILAGSDKVIWAKWGLIQSLFLDNRIEESQGLLHELTKSQLTSNRASEWLARICINANQYSRAEAYLEQIREGELSLSATRLKALTFQALERGNEAISLLERKRESNRSVRERFEEITLDLARCYLFEAEEKELDARENDLHLAKFLIGSVGRKTIDTRLGTQKNYMYAAIAHLEENESKVKEILARPNMDRLDDAEISTLFDAINVNFVIGETEKANSLLAMGQRKLHDTEEGNDKAFSSILLTKNIQILGDHKTLALKINKEGLEKYLAKQFAQAVEKFHRAYTFFPTEAAYRLNLLQSLVEANMKQYKDIVTLDLLDELKKHNLKRDNKKRLIEITRNLHKKEPLFHIT